jgi:hypothetical protein
MSYHGGVEPGIARRRLCPLLALVASGCIPVDAFECSGNDGCVRNGVQGHCEAEGVCSYEDEECDSSRRYSPNAGALANRCVEDPVASDADTATTTASSSEASGNETASACDASAPDPGCDECTPVVVSGRAFELCAPARTWPQARDACVQRSLTLASIHGDAENEALGALVPWPDVVWIGLNDRDVDDAYAWVDLSPTDYLAWGPDQPDDPDMEQDCGALGNAGAWSTWRCETPNAYVCAEPP